MRYDNETTCHCGAAYGGSDHCPECGCEQYESGDCGHDEDSSRVFHSPACTLARIGEHGCSCAVVASGGKQR